jgi:hypothetical protein
MPAFCPWKSPDSGRHEYYINAIGPKRPTMNWIRLNFQDYGPSVTPGYSDGQDAGFGYERPRYFINPGWDIAYKKTYTAIPAADVQADPGTFMTNGRTTYLPSTGIPSTAFSAGWSAGKNPVFTIDLGSAQTCAAARMLQIVNVGSARYADSVQVLTSSDNVNYAYQTTFFGADVWNPPVNYLWFSRFDMFANESKEYMGIGMFNFYALFPAPVTAQYVRFQVTNGSAPVYISKLLVFDAVAAKRVDDEFAHGFTITTAVEEGPGPRSAAAADAGITVAPNPFNPAVVISVKTLHLKGKNPQKDKCDVSTITIYDAHGRMVHRAENINAGRYTWDASGLPSGLYIIRARTGERILEKKVTLLK